ncbi:MAG: 4Fe-4S dicluster domain-containing protein [Actinomycetota bacterium]
MSRHAIWHDAWNCVGCSACEIQCKTNKKLGPGPALCKIVRVEDLGGRMATDFVFMPCFHCEDAACLAACPTGAIRKRAQDGIVHIEPSQCIGCKSCIVSCPWGACQWDPAAGKAVKCDYCMDRLDQGLKPSCVTVCMTGCLSFGPSEQVPSAKRERHARLMAQHGGSHGDAG